jgi:uncharacterized protein DUF6644
VLFRLFVWYGETPIAHAMNSSEWMFPIVEVIHMIGIVLLVGTAVILDLRLMGLRLKSMPIWELASDLMPWTTAGLVTVLITGPLLLSTDADRYYDSYEFRFKMACLALVILFDIVVHRRVRAKDSAAGPGLQRFAGALSLLLWGCVVLGGRGIGILMYSVKR